MAQQNLENLGECMKAPKLSDLVLDVEGTREIRDMMKNRKKRRITIHLDEDLINHVRYLAMRNGGKYQTLLNHLIRSALENQTAQDERLTKLEKEVEKLKKKHVA